MIRIGLTGTMGAGKSTVGDLFESWGAHRVDADVLARRVVEPGQPGLAAIRETFGDVMLRADGTLDRAALRAVVFEDNGALRRLESIIHPAVDRLRHALMDQARSDGVRVTVLEIPLLFEKDLRGEFDSVVVVDAPEDVRRSRVCESRGLTPQEFEAMDSAQWSGGRKRAAADHVIWNDDDLESLESDSREVWDAVTGASAAYEERAQARVEWRVDLHMHTSASSDSLSSPADVVRQAREIGLDKIAITDHNEVDGAFEARDIDPNLVIVGEEVRTDEGLDLIGLFLTEHIPRGGTFRDVAEEIRRQLDECGAVYEEIEDEYVTMLDTDFLDQNFLADILEQLNRQLALQMRSEFDKKKGTYDFTLGKDKDTGITILDQEPQWYWHREAASGSVVELLLEQENSYIMNIQMGDFELIDFELGGIESEITIIESQ